MTDYFVFCSLCSQIADAIGGDCVRVRSQNYGPHVDASNQNANGQVESGVRTGKRYTFSYFFL